MLGMLTREARSVWQARGWLRARAGAPTRRSRAACDARPPRPPPRGRAGAGALRRGARRGSSRAAGRSSGASSWAGRRAPSCRCSSRICARPDGGGRWRSPFSRARAAASGAGAAPRWPPRPRRGSLTAGGGVGRGGAARRARRSPATAASRAARGSPTCSAATPHAFWFRPAQRRPRSVQGARPRARGGRRAACCGSTVDLVGDGSRARRRAAPSASTGLGLRYSAVIVSASHTHSGPGAYAESALFGLLALDRSRREVRGRIYSTRSRRGARGAQRRKRPRHRRQRAEAVPGLTESRVRRAGRCRAGRAQGGERRRTARWRSVELRHPRHRARPGQLPALGRPHGRRVRAHRGAARRAGALRQRRRRRREPPPARLGRRGRGRQTLSAAVVALWPRIAPDPDAAPAPPRRSPRCFRPRRRPRATAWAGGSPRGTRLGLRRRATALRRGRAVVTVGRSAWVTIPGRASRRDSASRSRPPGRARFDARLRGRRVQRLPRLLPGRPSTSARSSYIACAQPLRGAGRGAGARRGDGAARRLGDARERGGSAVSRAGVELLDEGEPAGERRLPAGGGVAVHDALRLTALSRRGWPPG